MLRLLIGYMDRPDGIQLLFYGATVAVIGILMLLGGEPAERQTQAVSAD